MLRDVDRQDILVVFWGNVLHGLQRRTLTKKYALRKGFSAPRAGGGCCLKKMQKGAIDPPPPHNTAPHNI